MQGLSNPQFLQARLEDERKTVREQQQSGVHGRGVRLARGFGGDQAFMSDAGYLEIAKARRNWKTEHLEQYLRSGGAEGHIVDVSDIGGRKFNTTLLLRYVGRKSGKTIITPLNYGDIGGEVVVVASRAAPIIIRRGI